MGKLLINKKEIKHNLDKLKKYLDNPVEETILVIAAPYSKLDERKAITKQVKQHAEMVACNPLKEQDSSNWIRSP